MFISLVKKCFPNAKRIFDRFHKSRGFSPLDSI
ncbi:transposase [Enterococcus faecalis]